MEEKHMVNDILENNQSEIIAFTNAFISAENPELKQIYTQLRSNLEAFYTELFTLAVSKGYYSPNAQAKPEEIARHQNSFRIKNRTGIFISCTIFHPMKFKIRLDNQGF